MMYLLEHSAIGWCFWDIPAFLVLLASIAFLIVKSRDEKNEEYELEERISGVYARKAREAEKILMEEADDTVNG